MVSQLWQEQHNLTVWSTLTGALLPKLTWFLPFLGPLVAIIALFRSCLVNLLVNFVSSRLQHFQVRLIMAQGFQSIPAEGGPGPYMSLKTVSKGLLNL